ncbi:MAG: hypothetical protein A2X32_11620 [Elusimicrobia bacterium GWC2_64_44]|nr:MAG: hypothetical protein A2X32_11620 [Elusimicrobia bacterium GWC2_64_44]
MRRAALLALAAGLLAACSGARPGGDGKREPPAGPGAATVFEKRTFKLVRTPDPDLEAALEPLLTAAYDAAVKRHAEASFSEIGFTYSLAPKGAVYPFSEIEVSCIMQDKYAVRRGPELCGAFYEDLEARLKKALAGKQ